MPRNVVRFSKSAISALSASTSWKLKIRGIDRDGQRTTMIYLGASYPSFLRTEELMYNPFRLIRDQGNSN